MREAGVARVTEWIARAWLAVPEVPRTLGSVTLEPHQRDAAARLRDIIGEYGGAMLADDTGMGKTFTALAVARGFAACTIVAPASLREMWAGALDDAGMSAAFVSFESLSRRGAPPGHWAPLTIVDEAHHARNPRTRRYEALARLTIGAQMLLLSATPIHNRARDLASQLALFLGTPAYALPRDSLARVVVRRGHAALINAALLPRVSRPRRLAIPAAAGVLRAIETLAPAVPPADGGTAHALLRLALVQAWSSSAAALRAVLRRLVMRARSLQYALEAGRYPTRGEMTAWTVFDDALQLAIPELLCPPSDLANIAQLRDAVEVHVAGLIAIRRALDAAPDADGARAAHLRLLRARHAGCRVVAFTHFVETARALFSATMRDGAVALVTAGGARIASGSISRHAVIERFDGSRPRSAAPRHLPLDLLITTDALSEGLNLQAASVLVHLDLPWTVARLQQRLGRLRRIGAPNSEVHVYAIGPPVHARALQLILRALRRKARVTATHFGAVDVSPQGPLIVGEHERLIHSSNGDIDPLAAEELIRQELRSWLVERPEREAHNDLQGAAIPANSRARDGGPEARVAVTSDPGLDAPWRALALVQVRGRPRLVAVSPEGVSENRLGILEVVRRTRKAGHQSSRDPGNRHQAPASGAELAITENAVHSVLRRWLAERRGEYLAGSATDMPSEDHARALRLIAQISKSLPRHFRAQVAVQAASCRRLAMQLQGAGIELVLREWADTVAMLSLSYAEMWHYITELRDKLCSVQRIEMQEERRYSVDAIAIVMGAAAVPPHAHHTRTAVYAAGSRDA